MEANTFDWVTEDGLKIYAVEWPVKDPLAVISIVHGMGEHIHRYEHVAAVYQAAGIAVVGNDHRGHGRSEGKRGHIPNMDLLLDEVGQLVKESKDRYPGVPHFLFGQSLGGNLVLSYALQRASDFAGVIASSPWIQLAFRPNPVSVTAGKLLKNIYPTFTQPTGLKAEHLSTDPKVGKVYVADPLVHDRITAAMGVEMLYAADRLDRYSGTFPCPLLIMHGTADQIVSPEAAQKFAERIQGDVTFIPWEGLYHELHNEFRKAEVLQTTLDWIKAKLT